MAVPADDYDFGMSATAVRRVFQLVERKGPGGRRVLRSENGATTEYLVAAGVTGEDWPDELLDPDIETLGNRQSPRRRFRLSAAGHCFEFDAIAVERITTRSTLYEPLHRRFALSGTERLAARGLLRLLRFPLGARLLRRWQASRTA